jgi:hypothetical protein
MGAFLISAIDTQKRNEGETATAFELMVILRLQAKEAD